MLISTCLTDSKYAKCRTNADVKMRITANFRKEADEMLQLLGGIGLPTVCWLNIEPKPKNDEYVTEKSTESVDE